MTPDTENTEYSKDTGGSLHSVEVTVLRKDEAKSIRNLPWSTLQEIIGLCCRMAYNLRDSPEQATKEQEGSVHRRESHRGDVISGPQGSLWEH